MKKQSPQPIHSISEQHRILGLPKPVHPLISVFTFDDMDHTQADKRPQTLVLELFCISLKRNVTGKIRYGQGYCDFDEGILFCTAPGQVTSNITDDHKPSGWCVVFHPDLIRGHALGQRIKQYGFFDYAVHEALHLSDQEETLMLSVMTMLRHELNERMDPYSEAVFMAHLDLLLSYTQRFYGRQFMTRKPISHDVLTRLESVLSDYFSNDKALSEGLPSVSYLAEKMNYSDSYLSDLLKTYTGQNTQQHIHRYVIEKAKSLLTQTSLTVSEIGFQLGFDFPQSFSRLFKNKTKVTPLQYRQSFA
ncbi:helix-turn-helix domain-containing protein [Spirosoma oryzicola]|uniref:helix-turn-helix domain-containing protein n=1 Tax=Spirosoma oryzicola TaxID=2898794 RepID=UPI001E455097|nr:helix-turn-helix transcriptional regulator [Spirosoma oryzicola]UHG94082.1 helix-turn-helix transcriptional regulator [Spirosoma oryzicola]